MKHIRLYTIATFAAVALAAAGCTQTVADAPEDNLGASPQAVGADADARPRGPMAMFEQGDKDKDGKLTRDEARAVAAEHFAALDANKDGQLAAEELAAMRGRGHQGGRGEGHGMKDRGPDEEGRAGRGCCNDGDGAGKAACDGQGPNGGERGERGPSRGPGHGPGRGLAELDKDGNGSISKDEAPPRLQASFDEVDTNQDGALDQAELQAWHEAHGPGKAGKGPGRGLAEMDEDGNGSVSAQEFEQAALERLSHMDANADGVVTKDELPDGRGPRKPL